MVSGWGTYVGEIFTADEGPVVFEGGFDNSSLGDELIVFPCAEVPELLDS